MQADKINVLKQIDLFKRPIMIRTERSLEGRAWDEQGGSFLGTIISILIFVGLTIYSNQIV